MARRNDKIGKDSVLKAEIAKRMAEIAEKGLKQSKLLVGGHPPGLTLQITAAGSASWLLRMTINGHRRELGLGVYRRKGDSANAPGRMSLRDAREEGAKIYEAARTGIDPVAALRTTQKEKQTFADCAAAYIAKEQSGWRNEKHAKQWEATLEGWAYPKIGNTPVEAIDLDAVEAILTQPVPKAGNKPLWLARHTTARRVRQRIEKVLDYAAAKELRAKDNPARIPGPLAELLPNAKKVKKVRNHASLLYAEMPEFWRTLQTMPGTGAQALQFTILTAARSGEVRNADWSEIDLDRALWIIPGEKMKAGEPHTVPLSKGALAVLARISGKRSGLIFPGAARDKDTGAPKAMSDMTLAAVLKRMKRNDITVHGFRSTFRTWADEQTAYSHRVKETALAHTISDETEGAYNRAKHVENRTKLMQDWCEYVTSAT